MASPSAPYKRPNTADTASPLVPKEYNKTGVSLEGPRGSGTMTYKKTETKRPAPLHSRPGSKTYGITEPTGSGKNIAGTTKIGEGVSARYIDIPQPHSDTRTGTKSNVDAPAVGQNAGTSRSAPKRALASTLVAASKTAPAKHKVKIHKYT